jgi:hypothetical protein
MRGASEEDNAREEKQLAAIKYTASGIQAGSRLATSCSIDPPS